MTLEFRVLHPDTDRVVTQFEIIHEKLFHLFLVSQDLEYFSHEHPILQRFRLVPAANATAKARHLSPAGGF